MRRRTSPTPESTDGVGLEGRLADARAAVLAREEARRREGRELPPATPRPPAGWLAAASAAWLVVALALISPPTFLRGATAEPFEPSPGQVEPSLRYGIWLAEQRVAGFVRREGRLPSFLAETGLQDSTITLKVTGERSYRLEAGMGGRVVRFESGMAADSFLGTSLKQLRDTP